MPIVPVANDVSIKTIREVINLKAVVLGVVRATSTSFNYYGVDLGNGRVTVKIKNVHDVSITVKIDILKDGSSIHSHTTSLAPGAQVTADKGGLSVKTSSRQHSNGRSGHVQYTGANSVYTVKLTEISGQGRTETVGVNLLSNHYSTICLRLNFPIERISIAQDVDNDSSGDIDEIGPGSADTTSNYERRSNVSIPNELPTVYTNKPSLGQWRGTQVVEGNSRVISSKKGRYGTEQSSGQILLRLNKIGFSTGNITVTVPNIKSVTKNISQSNNNAFVFNELPTGVHKTIIKDNITGNEKAIKWRVDAVPYHRSKTISVYAFNGDDIFQGF